MALPASWMWLRQGHFPVMAWSCKSRLAREPQQCSRVICVCIFAVVRASNRALAAMAGPWDGDVRPLHRIYWELLIVHTWRGA